jgi:hypothetical protein
MVDRGVLDDLADGGSLPVLMEGHFVQGSDDQVYLIKRGARVSVRGPRYEFFRAARRGVILLPDSLLDRIPLAKTSSFD